jgi:glycosidase
MILNFLNKYSILLMVSVLYFEHLNSQVIEADPIYPTINDAVDIIFYTDRCECPLAGYTGDIYAHTGVITDDGGGIWEYVIADWNVNLEKAKMVNVAENTYVLHITPSISEYYGIPDGISVTKLMFVFRNTDGIQQTGNLDYDVQDEGLSLEITLPSADTIVESGSTFTVEANAIRINTPPADSITLYIDNEMKAVSYDSTISYDITAGTDSLHWIKVVVDNGELSATDSIYYFIRDKLPTADLPDGLIDGINYINDTTVTLVLFAPYKENVFLIGDFNNWTLNNDYLMNRTPDSARYWLNLKGLSTGEEYAYQYLIDGNLRIADPYTEKILHPEYDLEIPPSTYPDLKPYPTGKTTGIVAVLQTAQEKYPWQEFAFIPPSVEKLVIYELFIRDFVETRDIKTVTDTLDYLESLGINAIELLPVNEFQGDLDFVWGYRPTFYFASKKNYGRKQDIQRFVEECHKRGIAVIVDVVLNHAFEQCPLVQMYFNEYSGKPTPESPWFNEECPHQPWCWGYDFNHESIETQKFVDRVNRFWLIEYNIDGFRFDFTKGFTNKVGDGSAYDDSRISLLKRMTDSIKAVKEDAFVIFEHLANNTEEKELSEYGILLWGNMNYNYNEATMGYHESGKSNLSGISYQSRGWSDPHLVGYMESHDEERLMYKNITWGASLDDYNVTILTTALQRMETAASFFFTVPGPKMVWQFGEIGYEYSKYTCPDGSVVDGDDICKQSAKPIRWDYLDDPDRERLYAVFSELIKLRNAYDVFQSDDFTMDVGFSLKSIHLNSAEMNVTIVGNFDLRSGKINPQFQHTGAWYDYFSGTDLEVADISDSLLLKAGEYRIYTDVKLETPDLPPGGYLPSVLQNQSDNEALQIYPNPATNALNIITSSSGNVQFDIYSLSGQLSHNIHYYSKSAVPYEIDLNFEPGIYIYKILTPESSIQGKLVIE